MPYFDGMLDAHHDEGYGKHLRAMCEPALRPSPDAARYRFLWLRTYHPAIALRVEATAGGATLHATELTGRAGMQTGEIARSMRIHLTAEQWAGVARRLERARFWELPATIELGGVPLDGAHWVLEGADGGRYHVVDRWDLTRRGEPPLLDLCLHLVALADLTPPPDEIY